MNMITKDMRETAEKLAKQYITNNPRELRYPIMLISSEDDSFSVYHFSLTEEELKVLRSWEALSPEEKDDYAHLDEFLTANGYDALEEKLTNVDSLFALNIVQDCDTSKPESFMKTSARIHLDGELTPSCTVLIPLSDEDYVTLLTEYLLEEGMTINRLLPLQPAIVAKIMPSAIGALERGVCYLRHDFVLSLDEIASVAEDIRKTNTEIKTNGR